MLKKCGIYKITNLVNEKFYIGSSNNLAKRRREHLWSLRKGNHVNDYLQKSFNKYGEECFKFEVIEYIDNQEDLLSIEQIYLDNTNACDRNIGYNINEYAVGGGLIGENNPNFGKPMPQETKEKIRQTMLGVKYSKERCLNMSKNRKGKCVGEANWNFGRMKTEEEKQKQSTNMKGRYVGENNPMYGKKLSKDAIEKMRKSKIGKTGEQCPNSVSIVQLTKDNNYINKFSAMQEAQRQTGIWASNIQKCCIGQLKSSGGFKWMYYEDYQALTK